MVVSSIILLLGKFHRHQSHPHHNFIQIDLTELEEKKKAKSIVIRQR